MAKTSLKVKQQRKPKYSTRAYTRCRLCGRPHAVLRKYGICRICFRELAYKVEIPASRMKKSIAEILKAEGYIADFEVIDDNKQGIIKVTMKYGANKEKVISGIKKISKPGLKKYAKAGEVPRVLGGLGIAIISTSKGVISDKEARKLGIGGEVICYVW